MHCGSAAPANAAAIPATKVRRSIRSILQRVCRPHTGPAEVIFAQIENKPKPQVFPVPSQVGGTGDLVMLPGIFDYHCPIKEAEVARFDFWVSVWKHREYFDLPSNILSGVIGNPLMKSSRRTKIRRCSAGLTASCMSWKATYRTPATGTAKRSGRIPQNTPSRRRSPH